MESTQHLLTDIALKLHHRSLRPVYRANQSIKKVRGHNGWWIDFTTVSGEDNLAQAVVMRLLTPMGELEHFGHRFYGSRLHEMVGRGNTETTRNLIRLRILESLHYEARIAEIIEVTVVPVAHQRSTVDATIIVRASDASETLSIGPLTLVLAP